MIVDYTSLVACRHCGRDGLHHTCTRCPRCKGTDPVTPYIVADDSAFVKSLQFWWAVVQMIVGVVCIAMLIAAAVQA